VTAGIIETAKFEAVTPPNRDIERVIVIAIHHEGKHAIDGGLGKNAIVVQGTPGGDCSIEARHVSSSGNPRRSRDDHTVKRVLPQCAQGFLRARVAAVGGVELRQAGFKVSWESNERIVQPQWPGNFVTQVAHDVPAIEALDKLCTNPVLIHEVVGTDRTRLIFQRHCRYRLRGFQPVPPFAARQLGRGLRKTAPM